MIGIAKGIAWAAAALVGGGAGFVALGVYDVSATDQHTRPVYALIEFAVRRAVGHHADPADTPALSSPALLEQGLRLYRDHCVQCHGAPGVAPEPFALGMTPVPANLVETARHWSAAEIHWTVRNGLKMTGMPAWEFRFTAEELWAVTGFVRLLPSLSPARYREMAAQADAPPRFAATGRPAGAADASVDAGDVERGRVALAQYACTTCHLIPGVVGATRQVGPPLSGLARRRHLAGLLHNTPENLAYWIRHPQRVDPRSAMPDLGVTEDHARDMVAYLSTLDGGR